jgi:hypothetical protein
MLEDSADLGPDRLSAFAAFFDAISEECWLVVAHDVFLSVVSPTAELDAVRPGPAYGVRQSLLMGLGTKGRLRFFSPTASSLWGKAIDGLRAGDGPRTRILQARWDF